MSSDAGKELLVLAVTEGGRDVEKSFHRKFAHLRIVNEWFAPESVLIDFIAEIGQTWDGMDEIPMRSLVALKGTRTFETWLDELVEHSNLETRINLIKAALKEYAMIKGFNEPRPKR